MHNTEKQPDNPYLIIPVGTQIVTRIEARGLGGGAVYPRGAVGVVIQAPADNTHAYRVRFPDGAESTMHRHEFTVRKHFQRGMLEEPGGALAEFVLDEYVIYRCVVGSRAYGLGNATSDTDRRGIYLPPAVLHWSLYGAPEQLEHKETEECYWELQKFLILALKANPNVLECLYTPLVETMTPLAEELLARRTIFLSKLVYQTYNGYVLSQFKKLEQDLRTRGHVRWKHAMHLIRLLLSGITVLREGVVPVCVAEHRDALLAIRHGQMSWEDVNAWRLRLHQEFNAAFTSTQLPDRPDYATANAFLIKARRRMVGE